VGAGVLGEVEDVSGDVGAPCPYHTHR